MNTAALNVFIDFCHANLKRDKEILDYIKSRNLSIDTIKKWKLGSLPLDPDRLNLLLQKLQPWSEETSTLLRYQHGGFESEFFNNRFIIPILNQYGETVAITGRTTATLEEQEQNKIVKYYNTVYSKTTQLFGLHQAIPTIIRTGEIIICEGNLDVISAHQAGIKNVVCVGTANVSPAQLGLAARYAKQIVIALDADAAGELAMERLKIRAPKVATELGIKLDFLKIEGAKDIDALLQKEQTW